MTKNYVNMAFRNHKFRPSPPTSQPVVEQTLKTHVVDGVDTYTCVDVDTSSKPLLPSADDYKLSALLRCGAPLNYVSPTIINDVDADADAFVNQLLSSDVPHDSDNQVVTPTD